jgi:hypothetical protein
LLTETIDKDKCKICKGSGYYYQGDIEDGMMVICNCVRNWTYVFEKVKSVHPTGNDKGRKNVTE